MLDSKTKPAQENVWIKSTCFMCWNTCGIRVNRIDGLIVKIEGDPECPQNWGKTCAKGNSGHMSLYDPQRVLFPMRRTNPEKGFGVDPKWERISWDEAQEIVTARLKKNPDGGSPKACSRLFRYSGSVRRVLDGVGGGIRNAEPVGRRGELFLRQRLPPGNLSDPRDMVR